MNPADFEGYRLMQNERSNQNLFQELEDRLATLEPKDVLKVRRDRWVVMAMFFGMAMTLPSIFGVKDEWGGWLALVGMPIELCSLVVLTYRQTRDVVPDFIDAKRKFALELDGHFVEYEKIRRWLQSLPSEDRVRRLAYVESRLESIAQRYLIVFRAIDKIGVLPALVGLFLQLQAIKTVSMATGILGVAVLLLYGMALWMTRFRLQLQSYARLIRAAERNKVTGGEVTNPP